MRHPRWLRGALSGAALITLLPLLGVVELALERHQRATRSVPGEAYLLPPAPVLRALAFGYDEVVADLLWVRTIAYFADHAFSDGELAYLERYLDSILTLDPHFKAIYRFGSAMMMSRGSHQTNEDVFHAIHLLERAHRLYPNEYRFPLHIGAYISELRPATPQQRARWRRLGADWVRRAALIGTELAWLPNLAASVYSEQGERELAIHHLRELYVVTQDTATKQQIASKLRQLLGRQAVDFAHEADRALAAQRASPLAFLSPDLFAVLHPGDLPPFDPTAEPDLP
ncbi:MAG: hypothetical protein IPL40_15835 [Proteobacteria bacterium]|nr:hypothetical protein [Pseudomonadota bacterium]